MKKKEILEALLELGVALRDINAKLDHLIQRHGPENEFCDELAF